MAEQIKADNEARQECNKVVDEARASGIPEEDIVSMKKELVSSEIKESIKVNGFMLELLGKILKKAVDALKSKIKNFKLPEKKIPVFDFDNYNKMVKVNKKLQKIRRRMIQKKRKVFYSSLRLMKRKQSIDQVNQRVSIKTAGNYRIIYSL